MGVGRVVVEETRQAPLAEDQPMGEVEEPERTPDGSRRRPRLSGSAAGQPGLTKTRALDSAEHALVGAVAQDARVARGDDERPDLMIGCQPPREADGVHSDAVHANEGARAREALVPAVRVARCRRRVGGHGPTMRLHTARERDFRDRLASRASFVRSGDEKVTFSRTRSANRNARR